MKTFTLSEGGWFPHCSDALDLTTIDQLRGSIATHFRSDSDLHKDGDEWACRKLHKIPGLKHMINAWKCDQTVAEILTDPKLGKVGAVLATRWLVGRSFVLGRGVVEAARS